MSGRGWMLSMALVLAVVGTMAAGCPAEEFQVPLTVQEPAGVARAGEPACGGIPLPAGQFKADQPFAVFDGDKEVPAQVLPLVVDEKGFLRWVLVDLQVTVQPGGKATYTLKAGKPAAGPASPLKVTDAADAVTIDTSKVVLTISKTKPFGLIDSVTVAGKPVVGKAAGTSGQVSYIDGFNGARYMAGKPASVAVEYVGPMRTTVCVKGGFVGDGQSKLGYVARITAWAGRSDVHVKYSLCNSNEEHYTFRQVRDSSIALRLASPVTETVVGADQPIVAGDNAWLNQTARVVKAAVHAEDKLGDASWLQATPGAKEPGGAKAASGGREVWVSPGQGEKAEGWIAAKTAAGTVCVDDLYFVEDPPRQLAVATGMLILSGIAEPMDGVKQPFADKYRWLFDCSHLSSQYRIDFAADADSLSARHKAARDKLWVMAPPAWYFRTEQLPVGRFGTQADELKCYDLWGWKYDPKEIPTHAGAGVMGNCPRWSGGDDNHYTSEQDTADAMILMYLRTGGRQFIDGAESWVNYFLDLQTWRTDGWRYKDGGVWWTEGGPLGSKAQRAKDPLTGMGSTNAKAVFPAPWTKEIQTPEKAFGRSTVEDLTSLANSKACYCHNWGEGLVEWFMITGDRDAYEAAIDTVEQNYDTQRRAFGKTPGKATSYSRDFTRASYLTNATRLIAPADPFVVEASDYLAACFLQRPTKEPRGFVNSAGPINDLPRASKPKDAPADWDEQAETQKAVEKWLANFVGWQGLAEMKKLGVTINYKTGELTDPKTGAKWFPLVEPHTWMFPPLSRAMELYYRITANKDARDWVIAFGQAAGYVLYQPRHGNLSYGRFLADFPVKGVCKDWASWVLPADAKNGEGSLLGPDGKAMLDRNGKPMVDKNGNPFPITINGYLAEFYPDVTARAYMYCGEPLLKQRAYDFWNFASHRGYNQPKESKIGQVAKWANCFTTHAESVCFTGKTFYEFAHPRADADPPAPVADLAVTVNGEKATVTFTAPAVKAGKVASYQVKCADRPIVDYQGFLTAWAENKDAAVCNWWMAANVQGEAAPGQGNKVSFEVTGVPAGAKFFAVRSFDDSNNRSAMSNVAGVK